MQTTDNVITMGDLVLTVVEERPPAVVSARAMLAALEGGPAILAAGEATYPPLPATPVLDADLVTIYTADILGWPVKYARGVRQVGRFALVEYEPLGFPDPEIVLAFCRGAESFNQAMALFQRVRNGGGDLRSWYRNAKTAAAGLVGPLRALEAHPLEADFVLRWALLKCAHGERA